MKKKPMNHLETSDELAPSEIADTLSLVEAAIGSASLHELVTTTIHGLGAMIDCVSCAWTEIPIDAFFGNTPPEITGDITDESLNIEKESSIFSRYACQHPCIAEMIQTKVDTPLAISDRIQRCEYQQLELYKLFYSNYGTEDQMTATSIYENVDLVGLSVNRNSWGFTTQERAILMNVSRCVFPLYRSLRQAAAAEGSGPHQPLIEVNIKQISSSSDLLGITPRESEVLALVACGKANKQIAQQIGISEGTVRKHLENTYRCLGVNNRVSAVLLSIAKIQSSSEQSIRSTRST